MKANPIKKFDRQKFETALNQLLIDHHATFAVIWLRDGDDLTCTGFSEGPDGLVVSQVIERWLDNHLLEIHAEVEEALVPKTEGMSDPLEAEFGDGTLPEVG